MRNMGSKTSLSGTSRRHCHWRRKMLALPTLYEICKICRLSEPMENPDELMEKFVNGDKSAGEKIVKAISSESFATKLVKVDIFSKLLEKGVISDKKTSGRILLKLSMNEAKEVSAKLITTVSGDFPKHITAFLECGQDGVEALTNIVLRKWDHDEQRRVAIQKLVPQLIQQLRNKNDESTQVACLNALIRLAMSSDHNLKPLTTTFLSMSYLLYYPPNVPPPFVPAQSCYYQPSFPKRKQTRISSRQ